VHAALFGPNPRLFCDIAEWNGEPAGFTVWFYNYSTFLARHGLYIEDLFVKPEFRERGIGKALLVNLAARAVAEAAGDWNGWCSIGTASPSSSMKPSAPARWKAGPCSASKAMR
jgi:GNAT superfamily N-acetyltransferase